MLTQAARGGICSETVKHQARAETAGVNECSQRPWEPGTGKRFVSNSKRIIHTTKMPCRFVSGKAIVSTTCWFSSRSNSSNQNSTFFETRLRDTLVEVRRRRCNTRSGLRIHIQGWVVQSPLEPPTNQVSAIPQSSFIFLSSSHGNGKNER
jgi:hypothetical protein